MMASAAASLGSSPLIQSVSGGIKGQTLSLATPTSLISTRYYSDAHAPPFDCLLVKFLQFLQLGIDLLSHVSTGSMINVGILPHGF